MEGLTLDTGALIALERRNRRITSAVAAAKRRGLLITVPSAVVVEWWRGQRGWMRGLLAPFDVEPLTSELAHIAGEALADVAGPSAVDAVVMASAAQRGDVVYTSDYDDLARLSPRFLACVYCACDTTKASRRLILSLARCHVQLAARPRPWM